MADNEVIIPDTAYENGFKLNFKNLFTFLSSLDYLKSLEFSKALRNMNSEQFYFIGEKQSLIMFVFTHTSLWIFGTYVVILLTTKFVFELPSVYGVVAIGLVWLLFGFWFVNRYAWGRGYLWAVTKDFMVNMTIASILMSIAMDFMVLYAIPWGYHMLVEWLNSGPKTGLLNSLAESVFIWLEALIRPFKETISLQFREFLPAYILISLIKVFSFSVPTMYMFYVHNKRKDLQTRLNAILKDIA